MRFLLHLAVLLVLLPLRLVLGLATWPLRARLVHRARTGANRVYRRAEVTARRLAGVNDPRFPHPVF